MNNGKIYIAGQNKTIGAALLRALDRSGSWNVPGTDPDPCDAAAVERFFAHEKPRFTIVAAGKSGGIEANRARPADLIRDNLLAASNLIEAAHRHGVRRLLYLASSCVYPKQCPQPMREDALFTGPLEPTNEAYAVGRLAGITLCKAYRTQHGVDFIAGIPADVFGPGDDFSLENSHVIPALIRKMHEAKVNGAPFVEAWGTGNPRREFLFADDLADACLYVINEYRGEGPINLGGGADCTIREIAEAVRDAVGFDGELRFDTTKPDGMPRKYLDSTQLLSLGWRPKTPLREALTRTYEWYLEMRHERKAV